jgi:hypothetical protein
MKAPKKNMVWVETSEGKGHWKEVFNPKAKKSKRTDVRWGRPDLPKPKAKRTPLPTPSARPGYTGSVR